MEPWLCFVLNTMDEATQMVLIVGGAVVGLLLVIVAVVGIWLCKHKGYHREHLEGIVAARRASAHVQKHDDYHNPVIQS